FATSLCCGTHAEPDRVKTYAATDSFEPSVSSFAPTATVSSESDTDEPNHLAVPSPATSFCCWVQVAPDRTNTYAAPCSQVSSPTIAGSAEPATEGPKLELAAASRTTSFCGSAQLVPVRRNTYAAPGPPSPPVAPITAVSPKI